MKLPMCLISILWLRWFFAAFSLLALAFTLVWKLAPHRHDGARTRPSSRACPPCPRCSLPPSSSTSSCSARWTGRPTSGSTSSRLLPCWSTCSTACTQLRCRGGRPHTRRRRQGEGRSLQGVER
jgi:hypothetical protein